MSSNGHLCKHCQSPNVSLWEMSGCPTTWQHFTLSAHGRGRRMLDLEFGLNF